jgi:hypothetical protein
MKTRRKPNIDKALKKIDSASDELFGPVDVDISTLPCMTKPKKEKITANFDSDVLKTIRAIAYKERIPYTELMNDVLKNVFSKHKKAA